jgi:hypothetical protein
MTYLIVSQEKIMHAQYDIGSYLSLVTKEEIDTKRCTLCEDGLINLPFDGLSAHSLCFGTGFIKTYRVISGKILSSINAKNGMTYFLLLDNGSEYMLSVNNIRNLIEK